MIVVEGVVFLWDYDYFFLAIMGIAAVRGIEDTI